MNEKRRARREAMMWLVLLAFTFFVAWICDGTCGMSEEQPRRLSPPGAVR